MSPLATLSLLRRRCTIILLVALAALVMPTPSLYAQPILKGKQQMAHVETVAHWPPVRALFVAPGHAALPPSWNGALAVARPATPILGLPEVAAPAAPLPASPWLLLPLP